MSFIEWLKEASKGDPDRMMPYAPLYAIVDDLEVVIGDSFDLTVIVTWLRSKYDAVEEIRFTEALPVAEANWRLDSLSDEMPEEMEKAGAVAAEVVSVAPVPTKPEPKGTAMAIPPLPCGYRGVDGNECPEPSVLGGARCVKHGGMILDPDVRRSMLISAHAKMIRNTEFAIETLLDVMESGRNDIARVSAAKELLDRAGMTPEQHIVLSDIRTFEENDARSRENIDLMKTKLGAVRDRLRLVSIPVESKELPPTGSDS